MRALFLLPLLLAVPSPNPTPAVPANPPAPTAAPENPPAPTPVPEIPPAMTAVQAAPAEAPSGELDGIFEGVGWTDARWSVLALSLEQGDTLLARDPDASLAPASNMKLITSAAALRYLGPDFRFQTFLLGTGPVEGGTLQGDLVLYGTGDPSISDRFFEDRDVVFREMAAALREAGIRSVAGDLIGDESYFQGPRRAEGWDPRDLNDWFAAPVSALSYNENVFTMRIMPTAAGEPPEIRTLPPSAGVPTTNLARTGAGGRIQIRREDPDAPIRVEGGIGAGGREVWREMTVEDPARFAAASLRRVLEAEGIRVLGVTRTISDPAGSPVTGRTVVAPGLRDGDRVRILARHRSPPLTELLEVVNKRSHNLYSELLLLTVGRLVGTAGSFESGARAVRAFLLEEVGLDSTSIRQADGSGLSGLNRVSAGAFVTLLDHMSRSPHWEAYWESLPEAGNPRGLRRMFQTPAAGNLRAKTGTIENVSALSGIVRTANGERIAFSILANDVPSLSRAKGIEDRIGARLASVQRSFQPGTEPTRIASARDRPGATADSGAAGTEGEPSQPTGTERVAARAADDTARTPSGPEPGQASTGERSSRTHTVSSGENFTVIARRYGITLNALVEANSGLSPRQLQPGHELVIPGADPDDDATPDPRRTTDVRSHRVRPGENFTVIARRYGVSLNALLDANPDISPRSLQAGQTIRIPESTDDEER